MIREIISKQIKDKNLKKKDIAILIDVTPEYLSDLLNGKGEFSYEILLKLDKVFGLESNSLFTLMQSSKNYHLVMNNQFYKNICKSLEDNKVFPLLSKESLMMKIDSIFPAEASKYSEFLNSNNVEVNFMKYGDKPLAIFWFALMDRLYGHQKTETRFLKARGDVILTNSLKILFNSKKSFKRRNAELKKYLNDNGIILINSPFIKNSTIHGAAYKKGKQHFIFINDMKKREYSYIFTFVHELMHLYEDHNEDNYLVINKIKDIMKKENISHPELLKAWELMEQEKYDELYKETKLRVDFGDYKHFLENNI